MSKKILTFGEIMGRLQPEGFNRLPQSLPGNLQFTFGGAEANVAASLARMGMEAGFITALPKNDIADACVAYLRGLGVDTSGILRSSKGRLGLYFLEAGANQRPSKVVYDRAHSTVSQTTAEAYDFPKRLAGAGWLHISGITPALSACAAEAVRRAAETAKSLGMQVSCDLNFRNKLWNWREGTDPRALAGEVMRGILPFVDVLIGNEEDASDVLSIRIESDVHSGHLEIGHYPEVARAIAVQFPNLRLIAITLRESHSASHNNWGAMLYEVAADAPHFAPWVDGEYQPYEIRNIVDRVGGGDAFAAGLIHALNHPDCASPDKAVAYAVAASCLAHSIVGDVNYSSRDEVMALMKGNASGRVQR